MPKSVRGVMDEFTRGALHSGSSAGPVVTNRKQAVAIALSEQRHPGRGRMRYDASNVRKDSVRHLKRGRS